MNEHKGEFVSTREKDLELAKSALNQTFDSYKDKGLLSIYLWGSILRSDYVPRKSDIDSIGIIDDVCSLDLQDEINGQLKELAPKLFDFRINLIRLSEIRGAVPESRLATVIPPEMLLVEFSTWEHVSGKDYSVSELAKTTPSTKSALCRNIAVIKSQYLPNIQSGDFSKYKSFLKQTMHACHFSNMLEKEYVPFTYDGLLSESTEANNQLAIVLLEARKNEWRQLDSQYFNLVTSWLDWVDNLVCNRDTN